MSGAPQPTHKQLAALVALTRAHWAEQAGVGASHAALDALRGRTSADELAGWLRTLGPKEWARVHSDWAEDAASGLWDLALEATGTLLAASVLAGGPDQEVMARAATQTAQAVLRELPASSVRAPSREDAGQWAQWQHEARDAMAALNTVCAVAAATVLAAGRGEGLVAHCAGCAHWQTSQAPVLHHSTGHLVAHQVAWAGPGEGQRRPAWFPQASEFDPETQSDPALSSWAVVCAGLRSLWDGAAGLMDEGSCNRCGTRGTLATFVAPQGGVR